MRGYRINPYVAEYLMNPRRRRHGRGRHHYRSNPASGVLRAVQGTFDMRSIQSGAVATGGALLTITVGNLALSYIAPYAPASLQTGYFGIAAKAAVRSGIAFLLDMYLVGKITSDRTAFRIGAGIGIFGSALLEALGRSLIIGQGDASQTIQSFVPVSIPGLTSYSRGGGLTRGTSVNAYSRGGRVSMGALNVGNGTMLGNEAHQRLYGYGS